MWNENVKCCEKDCDESDYERERVVEIFKVNRDYEILVQSFVLYCIEREEQIASFCKIKIDDCIDNSNINPPVVRVSVLVTADTYSCLLYTSRCV